MKKLGVIIVDDEQDAINAVVESIKLGDVPCEILAATNNPLEAIGLILKHKPDMVFLDIEMPELSGFELLESIPNIDFEIVFVTAYDHYAIKAIKNNAVDYLLKPVSVSEINKALQKVQNRIGNGVNKPTDYKKLIDEISNNENRKIKINSSAGFELINLENIISIEANGMYSEITLKHSEKILITKPLKQIELQIESSDFFRVHRSYLINIQHVKRFDSEKSIIVMSDNSFVHLARRRKEKFKEVLENFLTT